jgi:hypothetical protein
MILDDYRANPSPVFRAVVAVGYSTGTFFFLENSSVRKDRRNKCPPRFVSPKIRGERKSFSHLTRSKKELINMSEKGNF